MFKKGIFFTALCLLATGAWAQNQQVMLDKVVAVVGGSSILYSEVQSTATQMRAERLSQGYTSDRDPFNEALEVILTQKLLFNQAQIDSVTINQGSVMMSVEDHITNMLTQAGSLQKLEAQSNMPIFNIRKMLTAGYEEQAYAQAMRGNIINDVKITPGEVDRFYNRIDKDSLPMIADQYVYAHITREPSTMNQAKQRTRERLIDMRQRVMEGTAKFETLAMMYSQDGAAVRGGEMDPTPLNSLDPKFAEALQTLKPDQISEVVESQFGFHIIKLIDKKGDLYHFRHIILRPEFTAEELTEPINFLDSLVRVIRADSINFQTAAFHYSDDASSRMNGGIVTNHDYLESRMAFNAELTATKFLREDFGTFKSIDDYNALSKLKEGEISPAFSTEDLLGNVLAKVVKLVKIIPTHRASIDDDYVRLEQIALNQKRQTVFNEWLSEKIDRMYVYIAPEYRDGDFANKNWVK